ncbi:hypothetical protein BN1013_00002 [Candidatus Rubidus massiliensis]|nr:hypothetical protein BN1013_00002 [Candidatus Rubidus massiliensis]
MSGKEASSIPTKSKVFCILQLCISFTIISFWLIYPFLGLQFSLKSASIPYEFVFGKMTSPSSSSDIEKKLELNRNLFNQIPEFVQNSLIEKYRHIQQFLKLSFRDRINLSLYMFFYGIYFFDRIWLIASIFISISLLKGKVSSRGTLLIIPFLSLFCIGSSLITPKEQKQDPFPSETALLTNYVLPNDTLAYKDLLEKAWKNYLILDWLKEKPSPNDEIYLEQASKGEFLFTVNYLEKTPNWSLQTHLHPKPAPLLFEILNCLWSFLFCIICYKELKI